MSVHRLLALALDMADGDFIRHWSGQGRLPTFASLIRSGAWIDLESTAQVLHTSTWPTFATGVLPGKHGVYFPYQPRPGSQLAQHVQADQYGANTFWYLSAQQGCSCIVYDVPETFPEPGFPGKAIFDWGTWAWYGTPGSQPATLLKQINRRFGRYPLGFEAKRLGASMPNLAVMEDRLLRSVEYKRRTAEWLLQQDPWNLAVIGFCEGHAAGHYLWPAGTEVGDATDEGKIKTLLRFYGALDQAIGALIAGVPPDTALFIVSGDGMRPNRCAWYLLPTVLERMGYTRPMSDPESGRRSSTSLVSRAKGLLSPKARRKVAELLPWWLRDRLGAREQAANIEWSKTRAFTLPSDLEGCIRINLKGREPYGIVHPGAEYRDLCDEIRGNLQELINPVSGLPAVGRVWLRNEVFPGERQEQLPDLIVTWNDKAPFTSLASPRFGTIEGDTADPRPGTHSPSGFLLAVGKSLPQRLEAHGRLIDVAPTAMKLLGLTPPSSMDGVALSSLTQPVSSGKSQHFVAPETLR